MRAVRIGGKLRRLRQDKRLTQAQMAAELAISPSYLNLLESMNRRAQLQLQLQETVEGLSVVAISYYLMGLIKVLLEGVGELRHTLNPTLATGLLAPFVVLLVWRLLHRIRMRIGHG